MVQGAAGAGKAKDSSDPAAPGHPVRPLLASLQRPLITARPGLLYAKHWLTPGNNHILIISLPIIVCNVLISDR